jgi:hypothetical protein
MHEPRNLDEPLSETDDSPVAAPRRKWQTPRVLHADANFTRFDCLANHDGNGGSSS